MFAFLFVLVLFGFSTSAPAGTVAPCLDIGLRGSGCNDLACWNSKYFSTSTISSITIPNNNLQGNFYNAPPADLSKIVSFQMNNLTGPTAAGSTTIHILATALTTSNSSLSARISYDWTGDGTWDRSGLTTEQQWSATGNAAGLLNTPTAFAALNRGNILLELWSSTNSSSSIIVSTDKMSTISIPNKAYWFPPNTLSPTCAVNTTVGGSCNCVAFHLDTVQDFYLTGPSNAIISLFRSLGFPLTIAVIPNIFGSDTTIVGPVRTALNDGRWEIAANGWNYNGEDFGTLSLSSQNNLISQAVAKIQGSFNYKLTTFVPPCPNNCNANINTRAAMYNNSLNTLSNGGSIVADDYAMTGSSFYNYPYTLTGAIDGNWLSSIQNSISTMGFAVVSLDPASFGNATTNTPNPASIAALSSLLTSLNQSGIEILAVKDIPLDAASSANSSTPTNIKNCSCVTFRLDDIQDFFVTLQQKAVIDVFKQLDVPLTVGVIGYYFGDDTEIVSYVQNMQAYSAGWNGCFKMEVSNHGWLHEDFSTLNLTMQVLRMNLTQQKLALPAYLNTTSTTFIAPFNAFNANTLTAARSNGFTVFSSQVELDPPPYQYENQTMYRIPIGAATNDLSINAYFTPVPWTFTRNQIQESLTSYGFAAVMLHPYEFADRAGNTYNESYVNQTTLNELRNLLQWIKNSGLKVVLMKDVPKYFNSSYPYPSQCLFGSTTSPLTTSQLTTSPLTTSPLTTSPLTTSPLTTSSLTTSPLTTSPLTTSPLTTSPLTTSPLTTSPLTTSPLTSGDITTTPTTTSLLTSGDVTTSPLTTSPITSSPLVTDQLTTGQEDGQSASAESSAVLFIPSLFCLLLILL